MYKRYINFIIIIIISSFRHQSCYFLLEIRLFDQ